MNKNTRTISRAARQKLLSHHWPGNVRELRNVIERALILETASEIQPGSLPDFQLEGRLHKTAAPKLSGAESLDDRMANFERELITAMLEQNHFSLTQDRRAIEDQPPCLALPDAALEHRRRGRDWRRQPSPRRGKLHHHDPNTVLPGRRGDEPDTGLLAVYGPLHPRTRSWSSAR